MVKCLLCKHEDVSSNLPAGIEKPYVVVCVPAIPNAEGGEAEMCGIHKGSLTCLSRQIDEFLVQ